MIEVHELTKKYDDLTRGEFTAVDGISFQATLARSMDCWVQTARVKQQCFESSAPS